MVHIPLFRWVFVVCWLGFSGSMSRYRFGICGMTWGTVYAGPIKIIWGPR